MAKRQTNDWGTEHYRSKHAVVLELVSANRGTEKRIRRLDCTEIDRLYNLGQITQDQQSAGISLAATLLAAGMAGPGAINWQSNVRTGDPQPISDRKAWAMHRVTAMMSLIGASHGRPGIDVALNCMALSLPTSNLPLLRAVLDLVGRSRERRVAPPTPASVIRDLR